MEEHFVGTEEPLHREGVATLRLLNASACLGLQLLGVWNKASASLAFSDFEAFARVDLSKAFYQNYEIV